MKHKQDKWINAANRHGDGFRGHHLLLMTSGGQWQQSDQHSRSTACINGFINQNACCLSNGILVVGKKSFCSTNSSDISKIQHQSFGDLRLPWIILLSISWFHLQQNWFISWCYLSLSWSIQLTVWISWRINKSDAWANFHKSYACDAQLGMSDDTLNGDKNDINLLETSDNFVYHNMWRAFSSTRILFIKVLPPSCSPLVDCWWGEHVGLRDGS